MKRLLYVLLPVLIIAFAACSSGQLSEPQEVYVPANVSLELEPEPEYAVQLAKYEVELLIRTSLITTGTSWIDYEIINHTEREYNYGEDFLLFFNNVLGFWEYTGMRPEAGWNDIYLILAPHSNNNSSIDIGYFFGSLQAGDYRIEKEIYSGDEAYIITADFTVIEENK